MNVWAKVYLTAGLVVMAAVAGLGVLFAYWLTVTPVLPTVEEPIPILNDDKTIAAGEPVQMQLTVDKPQFADVDQTTRFITCDGGTLLPIAPSAIDLPVGQWVIPVDSTRLPLGAAPGAECTYTFRVQYIVNPVRSEFIEWESETFTVAVATEEE